jgi:hypothetical protein
MVVNQREFRIQKSEIIKVYLDKDEVEKVWRIGKGITRIQRNQALEA